MRKLEDPFNFRYDLEINDNIHIKYHSFIEVTQGGPEIGIISINGKDISNKKFGGPFLYDEKYIYAPCFVKNILSSGFKLCEIKLKNLEVKEISNKIYPVVDLIKKEGNEILFYNSIYTDEVIIIQV